MAGACPVHHEESSAEALCGDHAVEVVAAFRKVAEDHPEMLPLEVLLAVCKVQELEVAAGPAGALEVSQPEVMSI